MENLPLLHNIDMSSYMSTAWQTLASLTFYLSAWTAIKKRKKEQQYTLWVGREISYISDWVLHINIVLAVDSRMSNNNTNNNHHHHHRRQKNLCDLYDKKAVVQMKPKQKQKKRNRTKMTMWISEKINLFVE